ncbi:MAG TPA: S9 family peptidase [Candidatus Eisenbacteria bacterium]|nr:S9 family peptidase [Candidatus Eisenbacteria bacterium]
MIRRFLVVASLTALVLVSPALAQTQRFSLDLVKKAVGVSGPRFSPDGKSIAFTVTRPNYDDARNETELWVADVATGSARQLTFERRSVSEPRFSPDGKSLAFLAPDSSGKAQIWLMPMGGGDARRITRSKTEVQHYAWRPDGAALAYAAEDEEPKKEGEAKHIATLDIGDQDIFLRNEIRPQHIWIQALKDSSAKRLTSGAWSLELVLPPGSPPSHLSWSPDGKQIAFARVPVVQTGRFDSVSVNVVDVATGVIRSLTGAHTFQNNAVWSPDGKSIAYVQPRDRRADLGWENEIYVSPAVGGEGKSVTRALDRDVFGAEWMGDGRSLLVAANDRTSVGLWIQPLTGPARKLELGELVINGAFGYDVTASSKGAIAFTATTPSRPAELYVMDSHTARPRRLTDFNAWAKDVNWGRMERVTWKNDGFDEDGVLAYPPNFNPAATYPLVLVIHGGPTAASHMSYSALAQLMAAEGWIVFQPNYRGSDNLGNTYQAAITKDAGAGPGRDVMAGVAELRKRAYVQKKNASVTGWSYGGYMTTWLIGNYPDEWASAVAGAPVTNLIDEYNLSDGNVTVRYSMGGSPWTDNRDSLYRAQSPVTYVKNVKCPTLIMSLMEDFRVPPSQALAYFHALKDMGVETQYIGFPGRGHNPRDPVHSMERTRLWVDWVRKHTTALP